MKNLIESGSVILGIEFGSTRIKSVLIGPDHTPLASGSHEWENDYVNGIWTYSEEAILHGFQASYADLKKNVKELCGAKLTRLAMMMISAVETTATTILLTM